MAEVKTFKCKNCPHTEQGTSPSVLIPHARDVHGRSNRKKEGEPKRTRRGRHAPAEPQADAEAQLLSTCVEAFTSAETDRFADERVIDYLMARFGPTAYSDEAEGGEE